MLDCLIIGGGPAGSTAAIYLGRFRRNISLIDGGASRAAFIPSTHNCPGFPEGISGNQLLSRLGNQASRYGARIISGIIERLERTDDGFVAHGAGSVIACRTVLLATGIVDVVPRMAHLRDAIADGCVRLCPVCDAYDVIDQTVAVVGRVSNALSHALFLRTYTPNVTVVPVDEPGALSAQERELANDGGICILEHSLSDIALTPIKSLLVTTSDAKEYEFDAAYAAMGATIRSELALELGAACAADGTLEVDAHQRTTTPGLYASGDVVNALHQISVATGHAAIAASHIHNSLQQTRARVAKSAHHPDVLIGVKRTAIA